MKSILITGGSGFIGRRLRAMLASKGYVVSILSRSPLPEPFEYSWNIDQGSLDEVAIKNADVIIHLAGADIGSKRWTRKRKKELFNSRIQSTKLLLKKVKELNPDLKAFIAASGVGYYGNKTSVIAKKEDDAPGDDLLARICKLWEKESMKFQEEGIRTVILRTGLVFSLNGGVFLKIAKPIEKGFGAVLGFGKQAVPWIHLVDLCNLYMEAVENENYSGIYNAVAPEQINNKSLTIKIADFYNKKIRLPNVPPFLLYLLIGNRANLLLKGTQVSCDKILKEGFEFKFPTMQSFFRN